MQGRCRHDAAVGGCASAGAICHGGKRSWAIGCGPRHARGREPDPAAHGLRSPAGVHPADGRGLHGFRDTVLDVFSHVGGFALAALAAGARHALAVDGSDAALQLAEGGARASGFADKLQTRTSDAFDALTALACEGASYGTIICDPPAFAPAKPALEAGLRAYEKVARLSAHLVEPGGTLTLCSCSHAADLAQFRTASLRGIGRAGRQCQILRTGFAGPDHPTHPQLAETGYLKVITFRILP